MSEDQVNNESKVEITDPTPEELLKHMQGWREKVENEIKDYEEQKNEVYLVYKRQRDLYDSWLVGKRNKMKRFDLLISNRKKVLMDVNKEIAKLSNGGTEPLPPTENA